VKDGMLEFYAGGESAHAILRLEEVIDAVEAAGLAVDMSSWLLKPQEVGVYVVANSIMTASQLEKAIESFDNATVKVMGILLDENRMCVVLHFSREIDYAAFDRTLKETGILIRGLCWGHWKYGWGFELEGEAQGHRRGARLKPMKVSDSVLEALVFSNEQLPEGCEIAKAKANEEMPFGITSNPYLSKDRAFIIPFVEEMFGETIDPDTVVEALFSVYEEKDEVGVFGLKFANGDSAERAAKVAESISKIEMIVHNDQIIALFWHDGASEACVVHMKKLIASALSVSEQH
jgi:hypothetical protein